MIRTGPATFEAFAVDPSGWPEQGPAEIAFVGRSNVGKSTLINTLARTRGLARTSKDPGRTRAVIFFRIEVAGKPDLRLVDLPGYGYARTSKQERLALSQAATGYIEEREALRAVLVLVDARRGLQPEDVELCAWLESLGRPFELVMTKIDQIAKNRRLQVAKAAQEALRMAHPPVLFSAREPGGREQVWRTIGALCVHGVV